MAETFKPDTPKQVREAVDWALGRETSLEVFGRASKRGLGRPAAGVHGLDLGNLSGVTLYEPGELVMSAAAATPLAEIEALLGDQRQRLAFEPMDLGPLLGGAAGAGNVGGTIGGLFACNLAGPRRIQAGAARDHILGFHAVSGRAEDFKSGGRVVKNVTGFDLSKLMAGSMGTLAVLTDVTFKVLPVPEKTRTVLLACADAATAVGAMATAMQSPLDVSGAAYLPADIAKGSAVSYVSGGGSGIAALRLEGPAPSVVARTETLRALLAPHGEIEELHGSNSAALWREIGSVAYLAGGSGEQVWRLSVPPGEGARVAERLAGLGGRLYFDWGGGLIWLALPAGDDAHHQAVRAAIGPGGGHAALIRAEDAVRARVPVFQPQPSALAALTRRVKDSFDPKGVLNPGRMTENL